MTPALCALRYRNANVPAVDKINYLIKWVDYALLSSQPILNSEWIWGSMSADLCDGVKKYLSVTFGKSKGDIFIDDKSR